MHACYGFGTLFVISFGGGGIVLTITAKHIIIMGQYYAPCILSKNKKKVENWFYTWDYGNGLKLMEHSWVGGYLVSAVCRFLFKNPQRIVWCGDYADGVDYYEQTDKDDSTKVPNNITYEELRTNDIPMQKWVLNHSKKVAVAIPPLTETWYIHPLPLLTALGNGQGGGDYWGLNQDLVGSWAGDIISISDKVPPSFSKETDNLFEED